MSKRTNPGSNKSVNGSRIAGLFGFLKDGLLGWFHSFWFNRNIKKDKLNIRARNLLIEPLEERQLLAVVSAASPDNMATEGNPVDSGSYWIGLDVVTNSDTTVAIKLEGTATGGGYYGTDYYLYDSSGNQLSTSENYDSNTGQYYYTCSVNITAGTLSTTIELRPVNDAAKESTETAVLTILESSAYTIDPANGAATISILDNDNWTVSVTATDSEAAELPSGSTNYGQYTITRLGETDLSNATTVFIAMTGTSTLGSDYNLYDSNGYQLYETDYYDYELGTCYYGYYVQIASGSTSATVELRANNDAVREGTELATMSMVSSASYTVSSTAGSASVNILDNDDWTVSVITTDGTAGELPTGPTNYGSWTISRSGETDLSNATNVDFVLSGTAGTASEYDSDYTLYAGTNQVSLNKSYNETLGQYVYTGTVAIAANETAVVLELRPNNDATKESTETALLTISSSNNYAVSETASTAQINITDNDNWTVSITATDATAAETSDNSNPASFTVSRSGESDTTHALTIWFAVSGTATLGNWDSNGDYRLYDSNGYELYENYQYDEFTGDYTSGYSVTIAAGTTTAVISAVPYDDAERESVETIILTVSSNNAYTVDSTSSSATAFISDNDDWLVSVSTTDNTAAELPSGSTNYGSWTVTRSGQTSTTNSLTVQFRLSGTATGGGDYGIDYRLYDASGNQISLNSYYDDSLGIYVYSGSVTIAAGSFTTTLELRPENDSTKESLETATLTLLDNSAYTVDSGNNTGSITIADNDNWTVSVTATDATAAEMTSGSNPGTFTFTRSGESDLSNALTVWFSVSGTASLSMYGSGGDYTLQNASGYELYEDYLYDPITGDYTYGYNVTIAAGTTSTTLSVLPIDDSDEESGETVIVTVTSSSNYTIDSNSSSATVNILDNDSNAPWTVSVTATDSVAAETVTGQTVNTGTIRLSRANGQDITQSLTVYFELTGTAAYNVDYANIANVSSYEVSGVWHYYGSAVIAANDSYIDIVVTPTDDTTEETTETVILTLLDNNAFLGTGGSSDPLYLLSSSNTSATVSIANRMTSAPTNLSASAYSYHEIALSWTAVTSAERYILERSFDNGSTWTTVNSNITGTLYTDSYLAANSTYSYRLYANNTAGDSPVSTTVTASVVSFLPPTDLTAQATDLTTIGLSWTPFDNATQYIIERSIDNQSWTTIQSNYSGTTYSDSSLAMGNTYYYRVSSWLSVPVTSAHSSVVSVALPLVLPTVPQLTSVLLVDSGTVSLAWSSASGADSYSLQRSVDETNWSVVQNNITSLTWQDSDTSLNANTYDYSYRLAAVNTAGSSAYAAAVSAIPAPTATFTLSTKTSDSVTLAWTDGNSDFPCLLQRSVDETSWTTVASGLTNNTYTDSSLSSETTYNYRIATATGTGLHSVFQTLSVTTNPLPPAAPTISVGTITDQSISILWTATANVDSWQLQRSTDETTWTTLDSDLTNAGYVDTGLPMRTAYYYRLYAINTGGTSPVSATVSAMTLAPTPAVPTLTPLSTSSIRVNWSAPYQSETFTLQRSLNGTEWSDIASNITVTTYTDSGLATDTLYYYRITSVYSPTEYYASQASSVKTFLYNNWQLGVTATDPTASEDANEYGTWTITRSGRTNLSSATTFDFAIQGNATTYDDYALYDSSGNPVGLECRYDDNTNRYEYHGSMTIPAGSLSTAIELRPANDGQREGTEWATLLLTPQTDIDLDAQASSASISIVDNDDWAVHLVQSANGLTEGLTTGATIQFVRSEATDLLWATTVKFRLGGTASWNANYSMSDYIVYAADGNQVAIMEEFDAAGTGSYYGYVMISTGQNSTFVRIEAVDDFFVEGSETVELAIVPDSSNSYRVGAAPAVSVSITDHDPWYVNIESLTSSAAESTVAEDRTATWRITRSGNDSFDQPMTVLLRWQGTAQYGIDYTTSTCQSVTIPANAASVDVSILVVNDSLREGSESIILTLLAEENSQFAHYYPGADTTASTTIQDNDDWTVNVSTFAATGRETLPEETPIPVVFRFTRSGSSDLTWPLTVCYLLEGTAERGYDYTLATGTWNDGQAFGTLTIPGGAPYVDLVLNAIDDTSLEDDETLSVVLLDYIGPADPWNPDYLEIAYRCGSSSLATATIGDSARTPQVSVAAMGNAGETLPDETARPAVFRFTRSGPDIADPLTVFYQIDGTASADVDFIPPAENSIVIPTGVDYVELSLAILDDELPESAETITVSITLSGSQPYRSVTTQSSAQLLVQDNDSSMSIDVPQTVDLPEGSTLNLTAQIG
ncbi:MAG: Calx-beta domain-containing protein, partial [Thermoguttaceae bacterium]|nr:Calx-beta domain-containing protein [Thermoguttaceae bacterium]